MHVAPQTVTPGQSQTTDAVVSTERALAAALQQHADALGLPEWAGQVVTNAAGEQWFGGVSLTPSGTPEILPTPNIQQLEPGLQLIQVCFSLTICWYEKGWEIFL